MIELVSRLAWGVNYSKPRVSQVADECGPKFAPLKYLRIEWRLNRPDSQGQSFFECTLAAKNGQLVFSVGLRGVLETASLLIELGDELLGVEARIRVVHALAAALQSHWHLISILIPTAIVNHGARASISRMIDGEARFRRLERVG